MRLRSGQLSGQGKDDIDLPSPRRRSSELEGDQSASDSDQTSSDTDQTTSDVDQSTADRDQAASEADQRASDRDQVISDRELSADPTSAHMLSHEQARADRDEGSIARMATTAVRAQIATERFEQARRRDDIARRRDQIAVARDREAEKLDEAAEEMTGEFDVDDPAVRVAAIARGAAAAARANAARDRERAASDRQAAERDRELLVGEIERDYMDEPTGAYGRRVGEVLLRHEFERALNISGTLTLGIVTIDASTPIEERHNGDPSRAARDRDLFLSLRARLRPYDPIVRWSETEFICVLVETIGADAGGRFERACADLAARHPGASTGLGLASLENHGDTFEDLVARARAGL